jgi:hypothetical protein
MDKNEPQTWNVTENRFRTVLMFFRIGGVPINTKNASLLHTTYNAVFAINAYALYFAFYAEIIIHSDDVKNFMKTFRILNSSTFLYWLHLNLRYILITECSRNNRISSVLIAPVVLHATYIQVLYTVALW